jgi:hypothetical protein
MTLDEEISFGNFMQKRFGGELIGGEPNFHFQLEGVSNIDDEDEAIDYMNEFLEGRYGAESIVYKTSIGTSFIDDDGDNMTGIVSYFSEDKIIIGSIRPLGY